MLDNLLSLHLDFQRAIRLDFIFLVGMYLPMMSGLTQTVPDGILDMCALSFVVAAQLGNGMEVLSVIFRARDSFVQVSMMKLNSGTLGLEHKLS